MVKQKIKPYSKEELLADYVLMIINVIEIENFYKIGKGEGYIGYNAVYKYFFFKPGESAFSLNDIPVVMTLGQIDSIIGKDRHPQKLLARIRIHLIENAQNTINELDHIIRSVVEEN
jgi:hypothetical protein